MSAFIFKASPSWGFSISRTQSYIETANKKELWNDPQWIKLGHYEKGWFFYSSPFGVGFFLSEEGSSSPKKELLKTIELLFSENADAQTSNDPNKHLQCLYLARTKWLTKILDVDPEDLMPCESMTKWRKELNVKSVALIFAAADMGNTSSSYGHTFLKIINPENAQNKDLIDYGINYAANADASEGFFYAMKGLFGMYSGQFTMLPYHQKIREYINLEGRDIWEYHLNFTPDEVSFLVDHLIEMQAARAPYFFFKDNCSYQILRALETVRPQLNLADDFKYFVIPIDTVKKITELNNDSELELVSFSKYKKSLKTDYLQSYRHLDILQKKALIQAVNYQNIPSDYELGAVERAQVFETAMKYYSIKAFRTEKNYEDEKYRLYLERVNLGQITLTAPDENTEPPEKSHDSSALYFGFGEQNRLHFSSLKFRNALHDLEQTDFGTVAFSHNEMASFEVRYTQPEENSNEKAQNSVKNFRLHRFTFLNLVNLNPVTILDSNLSWKVNAALRDEWKPDFDVAFGYSYDFPWFKRTRIGAFIS
ncbi:MAG: DUF4105 domain-containing protein, partial [Bdellovibrionaceae bacterium]|nr:DUF4105 domain-containing protein [Pseudobdellovibrionaceae bacterium]